MDCMRSLKLVALALSSLVLASCSGSGGSGGAASASPSPVAAVSLKGVVHGGQYPVSGSTVTVYQVGSGSAPSGVLVSTTTDANGDFNFASLDCPTASTLTYIVASGGNPGLATGTNNSAINLMAVLGACGSVPSSIVINEVTTVAAAYTLGNFIGPGGCVDCSAGTPTDVTNVHGSNTTLTNAMSTAAQLVAITSGSASPPLPSPTACTNSSSSSSSGSSYTPPVNCGLEETINSLANSLGACVNTTGPSSSECAQLFTCSTPGATYSSGSCTTSASTQPADTLTAALEIALNAATVSATGVYDAAPANPYFSPILSSAPNAWALVRGISGGSLDLSHGLAIDAVGDVWVANAGNNTLSEFLPNGQPAGNPYSGGGLSYPYAIAIDAAGYIWVVNNGATRSASSARPERPYWAAAAVPTPAAAGSTTPTRSPSMARATCGCPTTMAAASASSPPPERPCWAAAAVPTPPAAA
jgi:hypothetical protein